MASPGRTGARYLRARQEVLDASDTCWICGHGGSTDADHVIPLAVWPDQPVDPALMRPAHGVDGCPWCPRTADGKLRKCNQSRGASLTVRQPPRQSRPW